MAMVPMIAAAGVVQMAMLTGGYGDNDVRAYAAKHKAVERSAAAMKSGATKFTIL